MLKQYTAKRKIISKNIINDTIKRTCRNVNSFNFKQFSTFMNDSIEYLQVLVVQRRFCQINSPVMGSLYIYKLKINAKLQEKTVLKVRHASRSCTIVSFFDLLSQSFVFNVLISCRDWFKATKKLSLHILKLSKLINSKPLYRNASDIRFLQAGRLYFNHDVFSCAMVLLIISLSKTRINFIYVNITYVYVTEFMLAVPK